MRGKGEVVLLSLSLSLSLLFAAARWWTREPGRERQDRRGGIQIVMISQVHWRSSSKCSLNTFYRLVHVLVLEHIFLFLKFNHLVHFLIA